MWKLLKPLRERTDDYVESHADFCERVALAGALVVILGVTLEIYIVIENPPYGLPLQRLESFFADVLIAVGIVVEVGFGKRESACQSELRRRSNERLADAVKHAGEAHERAGQLELEAAHLRSELNPREITPEQYEILQTLAGKVDAVGITSYVDNESMYFARQIADTLRRAGIQVSLHEPRVGLTWTGIYIVLPRLSVDYTTEPIRNAFAAAGISAGCGTRDTHPLMGLPKDIPIIMVGEKRSLQQPRPPYVFTLPRATDSEGKVG